MKTSVEFFFVFEEQYFLHLLPLLAIDVSERKKYLDDWNWYRIFVGINRNWGSTEDLEHCVYVQTIMYRW